jgi:hypothetical protein
MENLHGLKDRRLKAPTPNQEKRNLGESADRNSGNSLLSKDVVNSSASANVIDLTGIHFYQTN